MSLIFCYKNMYDGMSCIQSELFVKLLSTIVLVHFFMCVCVSVCVTVSLRTVKCFEMCFHSFVKWWRDYTKAIFRNTYLYTVTDFVMINSQKSLRDIWVRCTIYYLQQNIDFKVLDIYAPFLLKWIGLHWDLFLYFQQMNSLSIKMILTCVTFLLNICLKLSATVA